jgi:hypothetical protein
MQVTPEQLYYLLEDVRMRYLPTWQYGLNRNPEAIAEILRREYGVDAVNQPPAFEVIVRDYVPGEWQARRRGGDQLVAGTAADRFRTTPPLTFEEQVLQDLDLLRSSPIAALVYVICRSAGVDNRRAIELGRLVNLVTVALTGCTRGGRAATGRAISGNSGQPRDEHITRAERQAETDQIGMPRQQQLPPPSTPPSPLPGTQPPLRRTPLRIPPATYRERMDRMAREHRRSTAPVR